MTIEIKNEYQWNDSFGTSMDVNKVVKELYEIQEEKGEIDPLFLIERAKDKKSVLHNYFLWDNKAAAQRYRLQQASELLRRIEVKVVKDGEPKTMRAFEIVNRPATTVANYISFDLADGLTRAKQIVLTDLHRCLSRINPYSEYSAAKIHIEAAIEVLFNVSTETKEEQPVLVG